MDYCEATRWEPGDIAHIQRAIQQVVKKYEEAMPQPDQADTPGHLDRVERKLYRSLKRRRMEKDSEITRYLAAPVAAIDTDVLGWWKFHVGEYPCLARIARDYLAIPATSVPAERVFSGGADLVTKKRGSLNEDSIQACMSLKSWLSAVNA
jgi:hAT family C-terminal dimerisation region